MIKRIDYEIKIRINTDSPVDTIRKELLEYLQESYVFDTVYDINIEKINYNMSDVPYIFRDYWRGD